MNTPSFPIFPQKVRTIAQYGLLIAGALAAVVSFAGDLSEGKDQLEEFVERGLEINAILHFLLVFLVLIPGRIQPINIDQAPSLHSENNLLNRKFLPSWNLLWMCWGIYYVVFFLGLGDSGELELIQLNQNFSVHIGVQEKANTFIRAIISLSNTLFIYLCYFAISPKLIAKINDSNFEKCWKRERNLGVFFVLILVAIEGSTKLFHDDYELYKVVFSIAYGIIGAVVLGLLAGRLDSKYLMGDARIVIFLFFYAAIMGFTSVYEQKDVFGKAAWAFTAFTLKCVFYIHISRIFEDRSILYYICRIRASETKQKPLI